MAVSLSDPGVRKGNMAGRNGKGNGTEIHGSGNVSNKYDSAVLIVSENTGLIGATREVLTPGNYKVDTATNLKEAMAKSSYAFDAVLVDPSLQIGEEGTEKRGTAQMDTAIRLLELFKGADPHLPLVFVQPTAQSAKSRAETLQNLMNRGANGFYDLETVTKEGESRDNFLKHLDDLIRTRTENQRGIAGTIGGNLAEHLASGQQAGEFSPQLGNAVIYTYGRNRRVGSGQRRLAWFKSEAIQGACSPIDPKFTYPPSSTGFYLKAASSRQEAEEAIRDNTWLRTEMPGRKITSPIGYYLSQGESAIMVWTFFIAMTGGHLQKTLAESSVANLTEDQRRLAREIARTDNNIHLENIIDWHMHTRTLTRPEDSQRAAQRYISQLAVIPGTVSAFTNASLLDEKQERSYNAALAVMNDPWQLILFSAVMDSFDENYGYVRGIQQPDAPTIIGAYAPKGEVDTQLMRSEYANWDNKPLGTRGTMWVDMFHQLDSQRRGLSELEKLQYTQRVLSKVLNTEDLDSFNPHVWDMLRAAAYKASRKAYVYLGHTQRTLLMSAKHENLDDAAVAAMVNDGVQVFNHYLMHAEKWWLTTAAFYAERGHAKPHFDQQMTLLGQILTGQTEAKSTLDGLRLEDLPTAEQPRVMKLRTLACVYGNLWRQYETVKTDKLLSAALSSGVLKV